MRHLIRAAIQDWFHSLNDNKMVSLNDLIQLELKVYVASKDTELPSSEALLKWIADIEQESINAHDFIKILMYHIDRLNVPYDVQKKVQHMVHHAYERGLRDSAK